MNSSIAYMRYVGKKDVEVDCLYGTGIIWNGNGDIQPVPSAKAEKFLQHPDCWEEVPLTQVLGTVQSLQAKAVAGAIKNLSDLDAKKNSLEAARQQAKAASKDAQSKKRKRKASAEDPPEGETPDAAQDVETPDAAQDVETPDAAQDEFKED